MAGRRKGRLELPKDLPLADGLGRALEDVLAYAREAAGSADRQPKRAVHEYRKSLRRARALVKLARPFIADAVYARLAAVLRDSQRATSPLRDGDTLRAALDELGGDVDLPGPVLRRRPTELLPAGARKLAPVARTFADALPADVDWKDLARGLRRSYRRGRRAMKKASRAGTPAALHDWRKATKELAYQLELVAGLLGPDAGRAQRRFAELAEELGEITDLHLLVRHLTRARREGPNASRARLAEVRREARRRMARAAKRATRRGRRLFAGRARKFLYADLRRAARRERTSQRKKVAAAHSQAKTSPTAA